MTADKPRPPLKRRPPPPRPWIDAFYVEHRHDRDAVSKPYLRPLSVLRAGPYSTYEAAQVAGETTLGCTDFAIEKRRCNPQCHPAFLDVEQVLDEPNRDFDEPDPDNDASDFVLSSQRQ